MKKIIILITLLLNLSAAGLSQQLQFEWQQCFGGSDYEDAQDIVKVGEEYMIVGYTNSTDGDISSNHGSNDVWLVKIDSSGNLIWEKCYGGSNGDGGCRIFNTDENDFFILSGATSSDGDISFDPYPGTDDYWIMKIDSAGTIIWDKIVGGNGHEQIWTGTSTSDGGVVAFGWSGSDDGDVSTWYGGYDMWMIKLDNSGATVWDLTLGTSGFDYGQAIIQTSDGGYLVGGTSRIEEGGNLECDPHSWKAEAILVKLDSNANIEWQHCYGGTEDEGITALLEVSDGYIYNAYSNSNDGDVSGFHGTPGDHVDCWIVKTDLSGNIVWEKCFGGSSDEFANQILQMSDGGFLIVGRTKSHDGDVSGNHTISEHNYDIWLFKISSEGELEWQQCIGGIANETIEFGVIKKNDHDFVLAGRATYSPSFDVDCSYHGGFGDFWVFEVKDTTVHSPSITYSGHNIDICPNPASSMLNITLPDDPDLSSLHFEILNVTGQRVSEYKVIAKHMEIKTKHLPDGLYILKLFKKENMIASRKFIICHME